MTVAEVVVEERTPRILIGNQETARLLEQASTSRRTSTRASNGTRRVGIRHAVKVGTASLYKQSHAVTGG